MLAPRAAGAEGIYLQVLRVYIYLHLLGLGQHGYRGRRGVYAPLGLGLWDPLDPMGPALVLQPAVRPIAVYQEADLLKAPQLGLVKGDYLRAPAPALGIGGLHEVEDIGEQG